jgi:hypothetical protein
VAFESPEIFLEVVTGYNYIVLPAILVQARMQLEHLVQGSAVNNSGQASSFEIYAYAVCDVERSDNFVFQP